jgi:lipoprotein-anchoring transpeptidase ErfK/SrfK
MKILQRLSSFAFAFLLTAASVCCPAYALSGKGASFAASSAAMQAKLTKPYQIIVDKETQILTVLSKDDLGNYTVVERQMVCSTAKQGRTTPTGTFRISTRRRWLNSPKAHSREQYALRINGKIWIHSTCFTKYDSNTLERDSYEGLGTPASAGCVRLCVADAKWIFDNCPSGTVVKVMKSGGPAAQCVEPLPPLPSGATYDPTDPAVQPVTADPQDLTKAHPIP